MLLSSDQFLSYRAKLKKYLGLGEKELDEQIDECLKEMPNLSDIDYWKPAKSVKEKEMANLSPDITNYELHIVPYNCNIDPDSELHWKIYDTMDWMLTKALNFNPASLDILSKDSIALRESTAVIKAMKELLEEELLTNVTTLKLNTCKDYNTYKEVLKVGIVLTLDQSYIDNYQDIVNQQIIENAIRTIQTKHDEPKENPKPVAPLNTYFSGTGASPVAGTMHYSQTTNQFHYFNGSSWDTFTGI